MKIKFMKKLLLCGALFFISTSLWAQESENAVVRANNQFAFDLYAKYKAKHENIFFSPYSLSSALAMVVEGARGSTAQEIQSVFHFPKEDDARRTGIQAIYNRINRESLTYELKTANALWVQKDFKLSEEYLKTIEQYYGGKATNCDFVKEAEPSRIIINTWIEEQTNGKIKDLIASGLLNGSTRLILTNAIYFKGKWLLKFNKENTKESDFRLNPLETVKTQMMSLMSKDFNYAETENLQILELPYQGNELSMIILLPKGEDLKKAEESFTLENLAAWKKLFSEEKVNVYLPRFKFETKYFMAQDLESMGMPTAFSDKADFSGMTASKDLAISEVVHQAFVDVNEEGTEAAAATAVMMKCTAMLNENEPKIFKADHPFIFLIQDNRTGNILFLGRVSNPNR